jgi:hypothetical protein
MKGTQPRKVDGSEEKAPAFFSLDLWHTKLVHRPKVGLPKALISLGF